MQCDDSVLNINEYLRIVREDGGIVVTTTNLNIRTDKGIKEQADRIFSELGLNMTTAINMFCEQLFVRTGFHFLLN